MICQYCEKKFLRKGKPHSINVLAVMYCQDCRREATKIYNGLSNGQVFQVHHFTNTRGSDIVRETLRLHGNTK